MRLATAISSVTLFILGTILLLSAGRGFVVAGGTGGDSITAPDADGSVGTHTSLQLDASGNPVVSYLDTAAGDLKLLHCNDLSCSGGNESISAPDTGAFVGKHGSLQLDAAGNPIVSYLDAANGDLKILHYNDPNCAGGDESITAPDAAGAVGWDTSLQLDATDNPVVSYYDITNGDLKILHCNDPNCAGGDESITAPDTGGVVGWDTSLQLDAAGYPVVSYYDSSNGDLKILHCNDPNCAGGGESITAPDTAADVGRYSLLQLDAFGNPVVSYYDLTNGDLKILHCNDPNCAGAADNITAPDTGGDVGAFTSLQLDAAGNPVVSYLDLTNFDLKFLHCNDPNCAGGDDSITSPDTGDDVGRDTSLQLDASGNPVVSYSDLTNFDLKLLHCDDPNCSAATPTPTPTPTPSPTPGPQLIQGDNDCDGDADSVDALKGLQYIAAVDFSQEPDCPALGGALPAGAPPDVFGDVDCDDDVDSVDQLKILQSVAAIAFTQNEPCTDVGQPFGLT